MSGGPASSIDWSYGYDHRDIMPGVGTIYHSRNFSGSLMVERFNMSQFVSPGARLLDESHNLITLLEHTQASSPFVREALARQQALHTELQHRQMQSDQALAEWRMALTHRWQCEIEGQRIYTQILRHLRDRYGEDSPHVQILLPSNNQHAGTAADLLNDMRRLHASLLLLQPQSVDADTLAHLEAMCQQLDEALAQTQHLERKRRATTIERRMAEDACRQAIDETTRQFGMVLEMNETARSNGQSNGTLVYADRARATG